MAKYDVKFSCGHTEARELFGKSEERQKKIRYWEDYGTCSECFKAQQAAKAQEESKEQGLPDLQGTEKQVAWANKIRLEIIESKKRAIAGYGVAATMMQELGLEGTLSKFCEEAKSRNATPEQVEKGTKNLQGLAKLIDNLQKIETETSAKWFIDNR